MSVRIMGGVWELDLEPAKKLVLLAMADHADHEGRNVHPSLPLIAWKTGYSPRQVQRIVHDLTEAGILKIQELGTGRGNPTHYRIFLEKGVKMSPFVRGKGCQDVTISDEKGDICDSERVTSETLKGDIAMSPEPLREPSLRNNNNVAGEANGFRPTYVAVLGDAYPKVRDKFRALDPEFTDGAFKSMLQGLERDVGALPYDALSEAMHASYEATKRALVAERNGKNIAVLRPYVTKIIKGKLEEARDGANA